MTKGERQRAKVCIEGIESIESIESIECFAYASQTTSPQDYKTTSGCRMMLRYRFADYKSTRLQDYKTATASLVVSLTSCLVVWRSNAKLNFRNSIFPATALLVVSLTRCLVVWRSQVLDIKTRTVLVGKLSMPMYCCIGIDFSQCVYKLLHGLALLWCSCVVRLAVHIQASYVADAYAVCVVACTMGSRQFKRSAYLHSAV